MRLPGIDPLIAVVVSTRDRPQRLTRLLAALETQTLDAGRYEVIVVDNGIAPRPPGHAGTPVAVAEAALAGLQVRVLRPGTPGGPAAARNLGWRAARAPLIAFTDDDCEPTAAWLEAVLVAARRHPGAIVQGPTHPLAAERHYPGLLAHTVRIDALGPQYETCNIVYPRVVLSALDGFDESFGSEPAGEDTDLAWRALAAGHTAVFAPDAIVHHAVIALSPRDALRRAGRWSAVVRVFARHPAARVMLHRRCFWNVWHYLVWRSVLSIPAPRWLRRLVLARHALSLTRRAREAGVSGPSLLAAVPFLAIHDAVECAAIARGALRARTLVL